jgi:hypothetical protein
MAKTVNNRIVIVKSAPVKNIRSIINATSGNARAMAGRRFGVGRPVWNQPKR